MQYSICYSYHSRILREKVWDAGGIQDYKMRNMIEIIGRRTPTADFPRLYSSLRYNVWALRVDCLKDTTLDLYT